MNEFQGVNFPFHEITTPDFNIQLNWHLQDMLSYIGTWSAVKKYNLKKDEKIEQHIFNILKNEWKTSKQIQMKMCSYIRKKIK